MKAVVCEAPGKLFVEARPEPDAPPPGWALLDVSRVGICGTDYHIFEGKHPFLEYPRVMGHEVSGRIAAAGTGVRMPVGLPVVVNPYLSCGDCIACRRGKPNCCVRIAVLGVHRDGAMCERVLVPAANLYPAEGLSAEAAAAVEFLAIGAHAVRRSRPEGGGRALVIGAGPIGLGTAIFAGIAGLRVWLMDMSDERLAFARDALAIEGTIKPNDAPAIAGATGGEGFDIVYDATGNAASIEAAFEIVAHGGTLVLVSVVKDRIGFSDPEFHKREMTLLGSRNATREDFDHVMTAMRDGKVPLDRIVTHRTSLEDAPSDLARWAHQKSGLVKAMIAVGADFA